MISNGIYSVCVIKMSKMLSLYHTVYTAQHKSLPQLYHPAAQDRLPTEVKQGLSLVSTWLTYWEN